MRTTLLIIVILGLPIFFFSCYPCGNGGDPGFWTISSVETHALREDLQTEIFTGDTIFEDSLNFRLQLHTTFLSQNTFRYNPYTAMACSPADPTQTNKIVKINWGLKYPGNNSLDTSISNSLSVSRGSIRWKWTTQKHEFIQELSDEFSVPPLILVKMQSKHNQSNIQLVMQMMKQNGDTLVATGPVLFCK